MTSNSLLLSGIIPNKLIIVGNINQKIIQKIFFKMQIDLDKIKKSKELIVHKGIKDSQEMRFKRAGEAFPMGLRKNRYFGCFWDRS